MTDDAQRSDVMSVAHLYGNSRVGRDFRFADHKRIVEKPRILCRVLDNKNVVLSNRMPAEGDVARRFGRV